MTEEIIEPSDVKEEIVKVEGLPTTLPRKRGRKPKVKAVPPSPTVEHPKPLKRTRKSPTPKAFKGASSYAEKRLAEAIKERAEAMGKVAALNAEIPSLVQIIRALGTTQNPAPLDYTNVPLYPTNYDITHVVSDAPTPVTNRPRQTQTTIEQVEPPVQFPTPTKAMGGAIGGIDLDPIAEDPDEDAFLKDSGVAGGTWH